MVEGIQSMGRVCDGRIEWEILTRNMLSCMSLNLAFNVDGVKKVVNLSR